MSQLFIDQNQDGILKKFLKTHQRELDEFTARERNEVAVASRFRWFSDAISRQENFVAGLRLHCGLYTGSEVARTLYENSKNHPNGPAQLANLALELAPALVLRSHGAEVVSLGETELSGLQAEFEQFKQTNAHVLKGLGLI